MLYVFIYLCVCAFLCVHYHLHWVCEHHTVEANEVLVVQGVHGVNLTDEILQSFRLAEHICLQTLHSYIHLKINARISYDSFTLNNIFLYGELNYFDKFKLPHHLPCRCQPLSSLHDSKGAVPKLLKQRQVLLRDKASQSLLLLIKGSTTTTRLCSQDSVPQAQGRGGRQLSKGGGGLALLGEVSSIWTLTTKYLQRTRGRKW